MSDLAGNVGNTPVARNTNNASPKKPSNTALANNLIKGLVGEQTRSSLGNAGRAGRGGRAGNAYNEGDLNLFAGTLNNLKDIDPYKNSAVVKLPHHIHVYAHKHNTHITVTKPNRDPLLSLSCGSIGFRKGNRGNFDASYQLAAYTMGKIQEKGYLMKMDAIEIVLRGYGPGRDSFTKCLLGSEGRNIQPLVTQVTDATRLKFGGTRSPRVRRL